jgi:hypothetical protein
MADKTSSRVATGRRRARAAQIVLAAAGVAVFGSAMALARTTQAGHTRRALRPLAAPASFERIVRRDQLQAGVIAPAQASAQAQTHLS